MSASASNLDFAREALGIFSSEFPQHYARIARTLRSAPGRYTVGSEEIALVSSGGEIHVTRARDGLEVQLQARVAAVDIVRLVDGSAMLETLLAEERLEIFAGDDALLLVAESLAIFLDGAMSSRALADLFERYRVWVAAAR